MVYIEESQKKYKKKDFIPQHSALAEHADSYLSKIIGKYKNEIDTIYHYEEDMYVSQRSKSENIDRTKNSIEIEMAFPSQRKTEVLFKTGESIDVCDTSCIYQGDIILSERDIDILAGVTPIEEEGIQLRGALLNYSKYKWKDPLPLPGGQDGGDRAAGIQRQADLHLPRARPRRHMARHRAARRHPHRQIGRAHV